jgi:carbapenam-3-carboxylate synthase
LLSVYDTGALVANAAGLTLIAFQTLGSQVLALFDGAFSGALIEPEIGSVSVFTDCNGQMAAYATYEQQPWFAPEIKLFCLRDDFAPTFLAVDQVTEFKWREDGFCPVTNVNKVTPGQMMTVRANENVAPSVSTNLYHAYRPASDRVLSSAVAQSTIERLLGEAVANGMAGGQRIGIPLSGGLDSSIVTALASRLSPELQTFCIGTEVSAEFEYAETMARHVGSKHSAFLLSEDDVVDGIVRSIRFNEIYDGLSAEIQSSLFALYRRVEGSVDTLVSGYGADLLFGGVVPPQSPTRAVNLGLWDQIYRTRWTGEFSPIGAGHHGIRVRHPFWSNRLLGFCLDLAPALKVSIDEVKLCLRAFASNRDTVPSEIARRKKIGIHEGSSVNTIFSGIVGSNSYTAKNRFAYFAYRHMLGSPKNQMTPSDELLALFLRIE